MKFLVLSFFVIFQTKLASCSVGDSSNTYQRCLYDCSFANCTRDGERFAKGNIQHQPVYNRILGWTCREECKYQCMWETVATFQERNWPTPQFHGKWPFIRILGIQEPASAIFSLLNLYAHIKMIQKFRKEVRSDSPLYILWWLYFAVCCNTWIWSTIFHSRDTVLTEFMDYTCAFAMVLMNFYCAIVRLTRNVLPRFATIMMTTFFVAFYTNHVMYLSTKFDYGYNMQVNITVGTITAILWFGWSTWKRFRQPYVYKVALFVSLSGIVTLLEVWDVPPILWTFDCHAIWHLSTVPIICIFYSFIIDDCRYLRKQEMQLIGDSETQRKDS